MSVIPKLEYPEDEKQYLYDLEQIFHDWKLAMERNPEVFEDYTANDFVFDGFYPYYFSQPVRVLFMGRESRGLSAHNYIEVLHHCYTRELRVGSQALNQAKFHRLLFYVAYMINNELCDWDDIPYPTNLSDTFATASGLSFAFMNISKFSNERDTWQAIPDLMKCAISGSCGERNFILEQIQLLRPHVVITMNLGEYLQILGDGLQLLEETPEVDAYRLKGQEKDEFLLLDTFHFSAVNKADKKHFVDPIRRFVEKYRNVWSDSHDPGDLLEKPVLSH